METYIFRVVVRDYFANIRGYTKGEAIENIQKAVKMIIEELIEVQTNGNEI